MARGVSLEALAMAGESHLLVDIDVDEWERREELDSESPPPHLLADESHLSVDERERREEPELERPPPHLLADESHLSDVEIYVDEWECREELVETESPPPHLLADDIVVAGDSSYCGEEWRSKKAVDIKRCLSCWVHKVVSDAAKSNLIISVGQERS